VRQRGRRRPGALAQCASPCEWWVQTRLQPWNPLALRVDGGRDKGVRTVIASNVDVVLLVIGLDADFSLRRVERCLLLVRSCGLLSVVVLSKPDLCQDLSSRLRALGCRRSPDTPTVPPDTRSTDCRDRLTHWLGAGRKAVLLGSSGAGKRTLITACWRAKCSARVQCGVASIGSASDDGRRAGAPDACAWLRSRADRLGASGPARCAPGSRDARP